MTTRSSVAKVLDRLRARREAARAELLSTMREPRYVGSARCAGRRAARPARARRGRRARRAAEAMGVVMEAPWAHLRKLCDGLGPRSTDSRAARGPDQGEAGAVRGRGARAGVRQAGADGSRAAPRRCRRCSGSHQDAVMAIGWLRAGGGRVPRLGGVHGRAGSPASRRRRATRPCGVAGGLGGSSPEASEVLGVRTEVRAGGGVVRRRGRPGPSSRSCIGRATTTGRSPRARRERGSRTRTAPSARCARRPGCGASGGPRSRLDRLRRSSRPPEDRAVLADVPGRRSVRAERRGRRAAMGRARRAAGALLTYDHDRARARRRTRVRSARVPRAPRQGR